MAPALSPPSLQGTLGLIEISTFVSILLLGFTTAQTYIYFCHFPHDRRIMRYSVLIIWVCNVAAAICLAWGVNISTIVLYGQPERSGQMPLQTVLSVMPGVIADRLVQVILSHRIYLLTRSIPLLFFLCSLAVLCLFGGSYSTYRAVVQRYDVELFQNDNWQWLCGTLVLEAITDILLTAAVCYFLTKGRRHATNMTLWKLDRLILWSVETGIITSLATFVTAVCFLYIKRSYAWIAIWAAVPGLYSNSLLVMLNGRVGLSGSTHYIADTPPSWLNMPPKPSANMYGAIVQSNAKHTLLSSHFASDIAIRDETESIPLTELRSTRSIYPYYESLHEDIDIDRTGVAGVLWRIGRRLTL